MKNQQKGLSLIEVMVSLVILVVGLIGIFNLHIIAKRGSFESFQQTQATYLANDIINRMKLNRSQLLLYRGTYAGLLSKPGKSCDVGVGATVICSNAETRTWDLYQWEQLFGGASELQGTKSVGGLDGATACVDVKATGEVLVVMTWRGVRSVSDGASNKSDFVKGCGTANDRRRTYSLSTVII
ncbi:type IV pilus modification protein PilV [Shewanella sp. GutCb]|uniref:type IV pilus modification protein PilV n=1 Tax=Shewanella sp. GutCb TaxID=2058315 RepID=UPI000C7D5D93|nr:type IV pilus modification protein PilV [Shewanella sp. GutCb]PKG76416.1 type IV pilus modification protein PilV [Shewanella sp. GutCb]